MKYFQICLTVAVIICTEALNCACLPNSAVPFYTHWQASGVWFKKNLTNMHLSKHAGDVPVRAVVSQQLVEGETSRSVILDDAHCVIPACMQQEVSTSDFPNAYIKKSKGREEEACIAHTLTSVLPKPSP